LPWLARSLSFAVLDLDLCGKELEDRI
jgi:hypothetical protein